MKGYVPGVTDIKGIFANSGQDTAKVVGQVGAYTILSFTKSSALNTNPAVTGLTWAAGKASGVVLCAMQIEPLPFASSYIPTNGSAVT
ncbi:phage head spike fiber domain-containing protein, partial [Listeria monocytogenes]|uniref:phage head spike fiber domain-containing protein n=1 Tax=Listeria monocytogenes TaxID=1639 RepID=UPI003CCA541C